MRWLQDGSRFYRALAFLVCAGLSLGSAFPADVTVVIYRRGVALALAPERRETRELVAKCEDQLRAADGSRHVRMDRALVAGLKDNEIGIEIGYTHPPSFVVPFSYYTLQPRRIFVPLTGEFARGTTTIFHASEGSGYSFDPYLNSHHDRWIAGLRPLLMRLGLSPAELEAQTEESVLV